MNNNDKITVGQWISTVTENYLKETLIIVLVYLSNRQFTWYLDPLNEYNDRFLGFCGLFVPWTETSGIYRSTGVTVSQIVISNAYNDS